MSRLLSAVLLLLMVMTASAEAAETLPKPVADFLATRKLLVTVPFESGSAELSTAARAVLKQNLDLLRSVDPYQYQFRIEGFTSPEGGAELNFSLAMERAKQVELFLQHYPDLAVNRSLTGIGVEQNSPLPQAQQRRVEIVRYDNLLQFDKLPAEKLTLH